MANTNLLRKIILFLIEFYQKTISPDHGFISSSYIIKRTGFIFPGISLMGCRFYPSCSQYTYQAINRYGLVRGVLKSIWRILRCNPLSKGGVDYV